MYCMQTYNRVYVSGMGSINAISNNISSFTTALQEGISGIGYVDYGNLMNIHIGAMITEPDINHLLERYHDESPQLVMNAKKILRRTTKVEKTAVLACMEAWHQAGLHTDDYGEDIGLVIGGSNLSQGLSYKMYSEFIQNPEYVSPVYASQFMDTNLVGYISELFGIYHEGFTIGGASASGNIALIKGMQMIQTGLCGKCIVIGALAELSPMELQSFINIGALAGKKFADYPLEACRPFDTCHEGFVYGQGCGCIILESENSMKLRGAHPVAEMLGSSMRLDGNRLTNPNMENESYVMHKAIQASGIDISDIDYINTHGSSSALGDECEAEAIQRTFGDSLQNIWVNSTKGLIGHCLYSAGVLEAIATIIQINNNFLHPNKNLLNPINNNIKFTKDTSVFCKMKTALTNSFGFGGINSSIVIRKVD